MTLTPVYPLQTSELETPQQPLFVTYDNCDLSLSGLSLCILVI
jgi:hypothetical protein